MGRCHPGNNCGSYRNGLDIPYTSQWGCCHLAKNCGSHRNGLNIPYTSQWAAATQGITVAHTGMGWIFTKLHNGLEDVPDIVFCCKILINLSCVRSTTSSVTFLTLESRTFEDLFKDLSETHSRTTMHTLTLQHTTSLHAAKFTK